MTAGSMIPATCNGHGGHSAGPWSQFLLPVLPIDLPAGGRCRLDPMTKPCRPLENQVLAALQHAMAEGRLDVAEHLLSALEMLCTDEIGGTPLADAYLLLADQPPAGPDAGAIHPQVVPVPKKGGRRSIRPSTR